MAAPKRSFQALQTTLSLLIVLIAIIPLTVYIILAYLILLPYALYNYSSNFGLQKPDIFIVQKYLDNFQSLHPRLSTNLNQVFQSPSWKAGKCPSAVRFWPHTSKTEYACIPFMAAATVTDYEFSQAAGLFIMLEDLHFPRRMLWEFLRDQVETQQPTLVTEAEKVEFRRVMEKMCTGHVLSIIIPGSGWDKKNHVVDDSGDGKGFQMPESVPMGWKVLPLREGDGMDWVLIERGWVVPMDWGAFSKAESFKKFGLWGMVKDDGDVEKWGLEGWWQCVDGGSV